MNYKQQLDFFSKEVEKQVDRYRNESSHYKTLAFRLMIVSVFLAATITVLLGIKIGDSVMIPVLSNISLFLGASITVLSAYEAFFDPRALWVIETVDTLNYWMKIKGAPDIEKNLKARADLGTEEKHQL